MVTLKSVLALALMIQGGQEPADLEAPPPDAYDPAYATWLAKEWGDYEGITFVTQPPTIRPLVWKAPRICEKAGSRLEDIVLYNMSVGQKGLAAGTIVDHLTLAEHGAFDGGADCAFARVFVEEDEVRFARAPGVTTVLIDGVPFAGDPNHRGWLGVPVPLTKGWNTIWLLGLGESFDFDLWKPMTRMVIASWLYQPLMREDLKASDDCYPFVYVFNASIEAADYLHNHYQDIVWPLSERTPFVDEWNDGWSAGPLQMFRFEWFYGLSTDRDWAQYGDEEQVLFAYEVFADVDSVPKQDRRLLPLFTDDPEPVIPVGFPDYWLNLKQHKSVAFVYDTSGSDKENAASFAAARWCSQRVLYEFGQQSNYLSKEEYGTWLTDGSYMFPGLVVHIGIDQDFDTRVLEVRGPTDTASGIREASIMASDAQTLGLVYLEDVLLAGLEDNARRWELRKGDSQR